MQLTSRAAVQLRGLPHPLPPAVVSTLRASGLLPSESHELVRNIVASPLSGLDRLGHCDLRPLVAALDDALCADPALSRLPGRFLFALDDGRGDVITTSFDLAVLATGPTSCLVLAGGARTGWAVQLEEAVPVLITLAREFVRRIDSLERAGRESVWHVSELAEPLSPEPRVEVVLPDPQEHPLGAVGDHAVVGVPLGLLGPGQVAALARACDRVLVTPWRSLVVEDGARALDRLESAGLVTRRGSPWLRLHACTGSPGCARSTLDTRTFARELAPAMPAGGLPVHVSGCERRCGTPATAYVDVVSPLSLEEALAAIRDGGPAWIDTGTGSRRTGVVRDG